ncbi:MAG: hypothetical protein ACREPI_09540 [Candidatus Dormibacterales bacterium]
MKHRILYAEIDWRRQRTMYVIFMVLAVGFAGYTYVGQKERLSSAVLIWLIYIPILAALLAFLRLNVMRSYVEAREEGILVNRFFSSVLIAYDNIRSVRVQPLGQAYQDGRRRLGNRPGIKPLLERPGLFVRLRGDDDTVASLSKRLGGKLTFEGTAAIPIADAQGLADEIAGRLPASAGGSNLGGGRRRKRRR